MKPGDILIPKTAMGGTSYRVKQVGTFGGSEKALLEYDPFETGEWMEGSWYDVDLLLSIYDVAHVGWPDTQKPEYCAALDDPKEWDRLRREKTHKALKGVFE